MTLDLQISLDGTITAIHSDDLMALAVELGTPTVRRASHVEPVGLQWGVWRADGADTGERFPKRGDALAWERANFWDLLKAG